MFVFIYCFYNSNNKILLLQYEFESCMSMLEAGAKLQDLAQIHISSPPPGPAPPKNLVDMIQVNLLSIYNLALLLRFCKV